MSRLARERIDDALPGSPNGPHGEGLAWHHKPKPGLTTGQLAANLGVAPSKVERMLADLGFRSRRKGSAGEYALTKTVPPELVRAVVAKLGVSQ